ncbi:unnamed protein product [Staurois parvus]|uniref:Uncharacterized protein n=1 Tax=Staurois parvus TaxID=386267 RepID=A0ABN9AQX9_9NEOB|nr:unnamed protein product [Staurois parvus]
MYTDHQGTHASAHQWHINATYQCPSELPFSVTHQCHLSMPPISATYQCHLSVPVSAAYQCASMCISAA